MRRMLCAYAHTWWNWAPRWALDRWSGGWTFDVRWLCFGFQVVRDYPASPPLPSRSDEGDQQQGGDEE